MTIEARHSGSCVCGQVRVALAGEPVATRQCWCRQCQKVATGSATNNAMFLNENVSITGALSSSAWPAASGNTLTVYFCSACATHIYAQSSARLHMKTVRLGVIDDAGALRPNVAIWTEEAPAWAVIDPALERFARQPPPPPGSEA